MIILFAVYIIAGYWATGWTIYYDKIVIYNKPGDLFIQRMCYGMVLGFILIPWALIKRHKIKKQGR